MADTHVLLPDCTTYMTDADIDTPKTYPVGNFGLPNRNGCILRDTRGAAYRITLVPRANSDRSHPP